MSHLIMSCSIFKCTVLPTNGAEICFLNIFALKFRSGVIVHNSSTSNYDSGTNVDLALIRTAVEVTVR